MFATLLYYLLVTLLVLLLAVSTPIICFVVWYKLTYEFVNSVCTSKARLDGKVAIVTGGNGGIGLEVARSLASRGARVVIACRDQRKASAAIEDIAATTGNNDVQFMRLDLADFSSVREFVTKFDAEYNQLHILVNNAGCGGLKHKQTVNGIDVVLQVNYFGHFLLTSLLLPKLIASKPSRIVIVSSFLYIFGKLNLLDLGCVDNESQFMKYANSKLCDILWTKALAKRLPEGVTMNALHPGAVKTDIFNKLQPVFRRIAYFVLDVMFKTPVEGAQTVIHLCVCERVANVSGKYFVECKEAKCSRQAEDDQLAERVWEKSVVMTQL